MSADPQPATDKLACCGEGGAHVPKKDDPQIPSCQLCPRSGAGHWTKRRG